LPSESAGGGGERLECPQRLLRFVGGTAGDLCEATVNRLGILRREERLRASVDHRLITDRTAARRTLPPMSTASSGRRSREALYRSFIAKPLGVDLQVLS
jgi:hypothetical protein